MTGGGVTLVPQPVAHAEPQLVPHASNYAGPHSSPEAPVPVTTTSLTS